MKKKILIIEDNLTTSKLYAKHLEKQGYVVEVAYDGKEGLAKAEKFRPDLILLDIIMPKMNGIETLKMIKSNPKISKTQIIMLTVLDTSEHITEAVAAGATHYLIKSEYSLEELENKVKELIG